MNISDLFSRMSKTPPQRAVYTQIVTKARQPWLYLQAGVPDTVTGRFDMITLHSFFLLEKLAGKGAAEAEFSQSLFDEVFLDMDHSLREMGVGDLSVGKKIRKMSEVFYGACNGYRKALAQKEKAEQTRQLTDALQRNITGKDADPEQLNNLVKYVFQSITQIDNIPLGKILDGKFKWPDITSEA